MKNSLKRLTCSLASTDGSAPGPARASGERLHPAHINFLARWASAKLYAFHGIAYWQGADTQIDYLRTGADAGRSLFSMILNSFYSFYDCYLIKSSGHISTVAPAAPPTMEPVLEAVDHVLAVISHHRPEGNNQLATVGIVKYPMMPIIRNVMYTALELSE